MTEQREVDHYIYFNDSNNRNEFKKEILDLGYEVTNEGKKEDYDNPFSLIITRLDSVTHNDINDITAELFDLAEEHDGIYDGWETKVITNSN
jgi:regulator of RNase E activity RraB